MLAKIEYRKPGDKRSSTRLVEPYEFQFHRDNTMVFCWQAKPQPVHSDGWRTFRVDRISAASVTNQRFKPKIQVTLNDGTVTEWEKGYRPEVKLPPPPGKAYMKCIEDALLDNRVTKDEIENAQLFKIGLDDHQIRGVHAQVYANILGEMLIDGEIDDKEARYLKGVSAFLEKLGWAP